MFFQGPFHLELSILVLSLTSLHRSLLLYSISVVSLPPVPSPPLPLSFSSLHPILLPTLPGFLILSILLFVSIVFFSNSLSPSLHVALRLWSLVVSLVIGSHGLSVHYGWGLRAACIIWRGRAVGGRVLLSYFENGLCVWVCVSYIKLWNDSNSPKEDDLHKRGNFHVHSWLLLFILVGKLIIKKS